MALHCSRGLTRCRFLLLQALPCYAKDHSALANVSEYSNILLTPSCQSVEKKGFHNFQLRGFRCSSPIRKSIDVEIQSMGESITEGQIAEIFKKEGDSVKEDETIAQIETDKVTIDVKAPSAGKISELKISVDDTVKVGQVVAIVTEGNEDGKERVGTTEPSDIQNDEEHDTDNQQQGKGEPEKVDNESKQEPLHKRQPSIRFPKRMTDDGRRLSELPESERTEGQGPAEKDKAAKAPQQGKSSIKESSSSKTSQPWYVGKEQGTKLSQSRVLSQREMEQIELGGAEP